MNFLKLTNSSTHFTQECKNGGILLRWETSLNLQNVSHIGVHSAYLYPFNATPKIEQLLSLCTNLIEQGDFNPNREAACLIIKAKSEIAVTHMDRGNSRNFR